MKKILLSFSIIVVVAVGAIGATRAFFSDTETSTGNTFTAGAIDLKIDNTQHYDGMVCVDTEEGEGVNYVWQEESQGSSTYPELIGEPCTGTWAIKDLVGEKFFNFLDIKPGDNGENTISLHVDNNEAWACMAVTNLEEDDNGQTEPEASDDIDDETSGELVETMEFFAWRDDGDNIYEEEDGEDLTDGPVKFTSLNNQSWAIADSTTESGPLDPNSTSYVGMAWCMGDMEIDGYTITCDGSEVNNASQTDKMSFDVAFDVVQSRNNLTYRCDNNHCVPVLENLFEDGFESNNFSKWDEATGNWSVFAGDGHDGSHFAFSFNNTEGDPVDEIVAEVDTSNHQNLTLSYWYRIVDSWPFEAGDHIDVEWSVDGTNWTLINSHAGPIGNTGAWQQLSFDLPSEASDANFRFRFRAELSDEVTSYADIFKVDDISLNGDTICSPVD